MLCNGDILLQHPQVRDQMMSVCTLGDQENIVEMDSDDNDNNVMVDDDEVESHNNDDDDDNEDTSIDIYHPSVYQASILFWARRSGIIP